jgi:heptosyltransferase-2
MSHKARGFLRVRAPLPKNPTDLVWLQTSFLGDIIITTAAMRLAAQRFPDARQHIITTRLGVAALADFPFLHTRIAFEKTDVGLFLSFRRVARELASALKSPEKTVLLRAHRSFRSSLLATYLNFPSIAYQEGDLSWLASRRVPRVSVLHEAARLGLLLEPLGVDRAALIEAKPFLSPLPLLNEIPWQARLQILPKPWIGIAPGSVWGTKRWTIEGFTELAQKLVERTRGSLVLLGSEKESGLANQIEESLISGDDKKSTQLRCINIAGMSDLDDIRRVVPRLAVLVTNDSSPVHYASAFDIPTVAIFGATVPEMGFGPLAKNSQSVGVSLPCRPCSDHGPQICPLRHFKCMRDLSSEAVYAAVTTKI